MFVCVIVCVCVCVCVCVSVSVCDTVCVCVGGGGCVRLTVKEKRSELVLKTVGFFKYLIIIFLNQFFSNRNNGYDLTSVPHRPDITVMVDWA